MNHDNDNPGELLIGAPAIAGALGIKTRQVYKLLYAGILPTFKLGGSVAARRSTLGAWLEEQERGARAAA
ncbi:DNA-binding protein [Aquibium sp. ELW1220]|uniref:helix-turn-helix transcriptional regulator n=1 Tax=Aquibium sp. ELW1220 TaxID=2976766 RepID=UPI0025B0E6F2|nr:DNA-binding protein [Aquibium sp. ELW1220]MDN2584062.1 helix-turn-helix domain-containing protein [Aquibium sp. ELW1220]